MGWTFQTHVHTFSLQTHTCHCPPEPEVALDLAQVLTGGFPQVLWHSTWCTGLKLSIIHQASRLKDGQLLFMFTSRNIASNVLPRPPVNILWSFCFSAYSSSFPQKIRMSVCLCSIVLSGCEMCDKFSSVQQSIPLTMIIKDALKHRTPSLLSPPHILLLCDLAVIWKLSAFLCLLSSFGCFLCVSSCLASNPTSLPR